MPFKVNALRLAPAALALVNEPEPTAVTASVTPLPVTKPVGTKETPLSEVLPSYVLTTLEAETDKPNCLTTEVPLTVVFESKFFAPESMLNALVPIEYVPAINFPALLY